MICTKKKKLLNKKHKHKKVPHLNEKLGGICGERKTFSFGKMRRLDVDRRRHRCTDAQVKEAR